MDDRAFLTALTGLMGKAVGNTELHADLGMLSCMRIMDSAELLHREALWLREIAARSRRYTAALPALDDEELRDVRKAVLHAWSVTATRSAFSS
ncbi:hypothetical protein [Streptomyces microflavus]|uniref:hypothetical protein n=1 Tax=Streptomyces microflavus TaxID=1919 RepID=UPI0013E0B2CA|nr:hypothetical protein [Streptomyces microflavus]